MRITTITTLIFAILFPAICQAGGTLYILGVDESGSYDLRPKVMKAVERFIRTLEPGDTLYVRRITDKSYIDGKETQLLPVPLQIPEAAPEFTRPAPTNRFDLVGQKKWNEDKAKSLRATKEAAVRTNALKEAAIRHIKGIAPRNSPNTDIYGFFAACADRLGAGADHFNHKVILIASDMIDNCKRKMDLDLAGAEVVVMAFEKDLDPKKTRALRDEWTTTLTAMKASRVSFLNPDEEIATLSGK